MRDKGRIGALIIAVLLLSITKECRAEMAGADAFSNAQWEQMFEDQVNGVVQSICVTQDYIITIENISDAPGEPDVVSAYYRNNQDENGKPVEQYSLAKRTSDTNWEHGNGMAYNPNTNEIYVALYTHADPNNRGCLFVMDPATLSYKRSIKISDDYNILGIGYKEDTNQYVIQTNTDGGYSFKILDENFKVVEDMGQYADTAKGENFQDLEVCGDYIMNFPLTLGMGIGDFIHVYSISQKRMVADPALDFRFTNVTEDEPESLCELEDGVFLAAVNVVEDTGARKIRFYKTEVPYLFSVAQIDENGQVVGEVQKVLRGESSNISFEAAEGYQVSELLVNGEKAEIEEGTTSLQLDDIQQNQKIRAVYAKIPVTGMLLQGAGELVQKILHTKVTVALLGIFSCVAALWAYIIHIRRERRRKYLRLRRRRESQQYASAFSR